jgi:hypothetical protein
MEENIGLVVLEHLCDQLNVHILNVDLLYTLVNHGQDEIKMERRTYLEALIHDHNGLVQFLLFERLDLYGYSRCICGD